MKISEIKKIKIEYTFKDLLKHLVDVKVLWKRHFHRDTDVTSSYWFYLAFANLRLLFKFMTVILN